MAKEKYKKREHRTAVISRWFDLFALSIVAILVCFLLDRQLLAFASDLEKLFSDWNSWVSMPIAVMLTAILWYILGRLGGACFSGFFTKKTICNPPVWFFGVTSFIFYFFLKLYLFKGGEYYRTDVIVKAVGITLGIFALGGGITCIVNFIVCGHTEGNRRAKTDTDLDGNTTNFDEIIKDPNMLIEWIQKEEPIEKPSQDYFDMDVFAQRIAYILKRTPIKTIGLVGPYGSGKSSILNLVNCYIASSKKLKGDTHVPISLDIYPSRDVIICQVSGWGFREGTAAQHVLQKAIKQLEKHTDCLSITTLPARYGRAIGDSGNVIARIIGALLCGWQSPIDILKKLDLLLDRIEKRMAIFIEDIDRNTRPDVFFNEISALLDGLKELKHVTFVLAIGEEHKGQEVLIKTSEHIETIPNLDRKLTIRVCEIFREHCLSKLDEKVRLISDEERDKYMGFGRSEVLEAAATFDERLEKPLDCVALLLNNPRIAKLSLRRSYQGWERLCGEIDFDNLFIANVLRAAAPEVFMFINQNIASFQYLSSVSDHAKERADKNRDKLQDEFNKISEGTKWNFEAANKLVGYLFPGWTEPAHTMYHSMRKSFRKYQYVENSWPTDYWARLTREELSTGEVRDQEILIALNEWNKDRQQKVFRRNMNMREGILSSEEVFNKVRQFKEFIDAETLRDLAQEQFQITLEKEKNKASNENCPAVGKLFLLRPDPLGLDNQDWRDWFFEQIKMVMPVSLGYANDVYAFWVEPKRYSPLELRSKIVKEAKRIYGGNPEALVRALDPGRFSIRHFARNYSERGQGGPGFEPKEWQWLGETLLKAGGKNAEIIIPQISVLLCDSNPRPKEQKGWDYSCKFLEELAQKLFGQKYKQLMDLLAKNIDVSMYDTQGKAFIACSQSYARKWLSDQGDVVV